MTETLKQTQRWIAIDCETTGFPPTGQLIEFGAIRFDEYGKILDKFHRFARPTDDIPEFISELTGITSYDVAQAPPPSRVISEFIEWSTQDAILVGHNIRFDLEILSQTSAEFLLTYDAQCVDTLVIARLINQFSDNRLETIGRELFPGESMPAHQALSDAHVVYRFLMEVLYGRFSDFRSLIHPIRASDMLKQ